MDTATAAFSDIPQPRPAIFLTPPQVTLVERFAPSAQPFFTADSTLEEVLIYKRQLLAKTGYIVLVDGTPEAIAFQEKYPKIGVSSHAVFIPFSIAPPIGDPTFTNAVYLSKPPIATGKLPEGTITRAEMAILKAHEEVHVLQWNGIGTLHQTPANTATNKNLGIMNSIATDVNTEKEAYAIQGWESWLGAKTDPEIREKSKAFVVSADKFGEFINEFSHLDPRAQLEAALKKAGDFAMKQIKAGSTMTMEEHYARRAVESYKKSDFLNADKRGLVPNVVFTRLGEDARKIGSVMSVPCLDLDGYDSVEAIHARLPDDLNAEIAAFNAKFKISDEWELQTADHAVASERLTMAQFLHNSKNHVRVSASGWAFLWHKDYVFTDRKQGAPGVAA
jgi:hypothetical protein